MKTSGFDSECAYPHRAGGLPYFTRSQPPEELHLGVTRLAMVSGDSRETTAHIAHELGITEFHGECLPGDKVTIMEGLTPKRVMMVGDGVNDAPVLAASDVGVALGAKGSTAASESADVVILVDNLAVVATALSIGQSTIRIALQSVWLGIIMSVGLMIVAAFGLLPAILGALLQEVVDLVAILGALRAVRAPRARRNGARLAPSVARVGA